MNFKLACGHTRRTKPFQSWLVLMREGCMRCLMEEKEAEAKEAEANAHWRATGEGTVASDD